MSKREWLIKTTPVSIELPSEDTVIIKWKDGHISTFDSFFIRVNSPDAESRGGHGGKIGDNTKHLTPPITIKSYELVGRYAYRFIFSDGHSVGLFSFEFLRELDENR